MSINLFDILDGLERVLPILGTMTGNPEIGLLAAKLLDMGEEEWERRSSASGKSRSEELADAKATFAAAKIANDELKALGHE
jgi:hypothetical protein